jgi:hypothetical protein
MALRMPPDSDAVDSTAAQGGLMRGPRENAPTATLSPLVNSGTFPLLAIAEV